ncbi:MAG: carbohydrate ABC transporter permease [Acetanaerobacterium sp.]
MQTLIKRLRSGAFALALGVCVLVALIPLLWVFRTAFITRDRAIDLFAPMQITLDNFRRVLDAVPFFDYYGNTLIIAAGILVTQFFMLTLAAYAFARLEFYGKSILFTLFLTQMMITPDVLIFPNYRLMGSLGLIDTHLGIMLPFFASALGIFLLRQSFKTIPMELEEAARIEGCGRLGLLVRIYVPLAKPAYIAFGLVSASYQWNNFLWPLVMVKSVSMRPVTVGLAIFAQSYETGAQWSDICAATFLVIAPLLLLFFLFQRQFLESFAHSGIK